MIFLNLVFVLLGFCKDCTILYLRCLQKTWLTRTKRQKLCNQSKSEDKLLNGIRVSVDKKQKLWKCLTRSDGSNTLHFVFLLFNDFYHLFLSKSENISTEEAWRVWSCSFTKDSIFRDSPPHAPSEKSALCNWPRVISERRVHVQNPNHVQTFYFPFQKCKFVENKICKREFRESNPNYY